MRFRVGLAYPASGGAAYSLLVPLAIVSGDSCEFMVGFCESIFRVPRGAILTFEALEIRPNISDPGFMPYSNASEYLGDIAPADAIRLYQERHLDHLAAWALIHQMRGQ